MKNIKQRRHPELDSGSHLVSGLSSGRDPRQKPSGMTTKY